jgi:hypothetical protein
MVESGVEATKGLTPAGRLALGLAAAVLVADQAVKAWILEGLNLPARVSVPVFGPLRLSMVWNEGVSFGFLQARHDLARWLVDPATGDARAEYAHDYVIHHPAKRRDKGAAGESSSTSSQGI